MGPGTVVTFGYELSDAEGELVETSTPVAPVEALIGYGQIAPALERVLDGLSVGEAREARLTAEEAFGPRDPEGLIEVDRAELPGVAVGDELMADREDGAGVVPLKVVEVRDEMVLLDTNHPLAGQPILIRVLVEGIRVATEAEIQSAAEALLQGGSPSGPLLPAERLLRRGPGQGPPGGAGPAAPPSTVA